MKIHPLRITAPDPSNPIETLTVVDSGGVVAAGRSAITRYSTDGVPGAAVTRTRDGGCVMSSDGVFAVGLASTDTFEEVEAVIYHVEQERSRRTGSLGTTGSLHGFLGISHQLLWCPAWSDGGGMASEMTILDLPAVFDAELDSLEKVVLAATSQFPGESEGVLPISDRRGERIFAGYPQEMSLVEWDVATRSPVACLQGTLPGLCPPSPSYEVRSTDGPGALTFAEEGERLTSLVLGSKAWFQVWDTRTKQLILRAGIKFRGSNIAHAKDPRRFFSVHPDGDRLLSARDGVVDCFDLNSMVRRWREAPIVPEPEDHIQRWQGGSDVTFATFLPDRRHILTVGAEMAFWSLDGAPVARWQAPGNVCAWALSCDGALTAADAQGGLSFHQVEGYTAPHAVDSQSLGWGRHVGPHAA